MPGNAYPAGVIACHVLLSDLPENHIITIAGPFNHDDTTRHCLMECMEIVVMAIMRTWGA